MNRISEDTVELNEIEQEAALEFDNLLDRGYGILDAVARVRRVFSDEELSEEFFQWLEG